MCTATPEVLSPSPMGSLLGLHPAVIEQSLMVMFASKYAQRPHTLNDKTLKNMDATFDMPNPTTMEAIDEATSGKELEPLDLDNFEQYVKSL